MLFAVVQSSRFFLARKRQVSRLCFRAVTAHVTKCLVGPLATNQSIDVKLPGCWARNCTSISYTNALLDGTGVAVYRQAAENFAHIQFSHWQRDGSTCRV
jgi:hypothetical protein